jgi:hypothetical protein
MSEVEACDVVTADADALDEIGPAIGEIATGGRLTESDERPKCLVCGGAYSIIRGDGRFCTPTCRGAYDGGYPASSGIKGPWRALPDGKRVRTWGPTLTDEELRLATLHFRPRGKGVEIRCVGCQRLFVSEGLRCCCTGCERQVRQREDGPGKKLSDNEIRAIASVAEVSLLMVSTKRRCEAPGCNRTIPKWTATGKATRKTVRFCTPKCARKAGKATQEQNPDFDEITARNSPVLLGSQGLIFGPTTPPLNLIGGYRFAGAPVIEVGIPTSPAPALDFAEMARGSPEAVLTAIEANKPLQNMGPQ